MRAKRSPFSCLALLAVGLMWGSTWLASGTLAEYIPPLRASATRFLLAALLCLPAMFRRKLPQGRALAASLLLPVTLIVLPTLLLRWARPQLPSATVAVLFAAMPLLLTVAPGRVAPQAAMQASIVALGAIAFTLNVSFVLSQVGAAAVGLLAVALAAGSSLMIRRELCGQNPVVVTALLLGTAGALLWLASLGLERGLELLWSRDAVLVETFLAVLPGAVGYAVYVWLLQRMEAYQVATLQWIQPLVAALEGAVLLRVRPSFSMIAGASITLVCLLVVMRMRAEDDDTVSLLGN